MINSDLECHTELGFSSTQNAAAAASASSFAEDDIKTVALENPPFFAPEVKNIRPGIASRAAVFEQLGSSGSTIRLDLLLAENWFGSLKGRRKESAGVFVTWVGFPMKSKDWMNSDSQTSELAKASRDELAMHNAPNPRGL